MDEIRQVLLGVEDTIDHPAHVIHPRLVDRALAALDAAGFVIVPRELLDRAATQMAISDYTTDHAVAEEMRALITDRVRDPAASAA